MGSEMCIRDSRMTVPKLPVAAEDPIEFQSQYGCHFQTWGDMTILEKKQCLHDFFLWKFSVDPKHLSMLPRQGCKRRPNLACWTGFWTSDGELDNVVNETIKAYVRECSEGVFPNPGPPGLCFKRQ